MGFFHDILGDVVKGPWDPHSKKSPLDPILKPVLKEQKRKFREKVDEAIHPDSDLGRVIHKARRLSDTFEEREENARTAPLNLTYVGKQKETYQLADHLFVRRGVYTHHAIYCGGSYVIHYQKEPGVSISIHYDTLENFARGGTIQCMSEWQSPLRYSREEAVLRARSRLEEEEYGLFGNNCEQFVRWCRNGGEQWGEE